MQDMRFVSGDHEALVLETKDGERYRLNIDEMVKAAVKQQATNATTTSLSPREIQDSVRSGITIAQLAESSGDSIDYITKFATPVIEELAHMVSSALAVRIEIAPDRFNEAQHREFGEIITERLQGGGASAISWSATRLNANTWEIKASFETMGGVGQAIWSFDPRKFTLSPENETALGLSSHDGFGDAPIPKLKAIPNEAIAPAVESTAEPTALLDAFKQRREAMAATREPSTPAEIEEEPSEEDSASVIEDSVPEEETQAPEPKKGRAPMPSWDEIVFGAKSED